MERPDASQIIAQYAKVARPIMLRWLKPNSCVQSTRITRDVLSQFKIDVQPIAVQWVVNVTSLKFAFISGIRGQEKEDLRKRSAKWIEREAGGWQGHLVGVADGRWLIDASVDQCASIEHNFQIPPEVLVIDMEGIEPAWTPTSTFIGNFTTLAPRENPQYFQPHDALMAIAQTIKRVCIYTQTLQNGLLVGEPEIHLIDQAQFNGRLKFYGVAPHPQIEEAMEQILREREKDEPCEPSA